MDRNEELISKRYDNLMFAHTPDQAKRAARLLADAVLGEDGVKLPLERAMAEVCRRIRPATDQRDQARFESEFLELVFAPTGGSAGAGDHSTQAGRRRAA